jgi:DtxR family Mn-dependent transcriptional regulator
MLTHTVEDYLKRLFIEQQNVGTELVPTGHLATCLGVTPGTATAMVKSLARQGLVDHQSRRGVRLTREGERHAIGVLRRHRIIELFLVKVLGMNWADVHVEAELMEHSVSDAVLMQMDSMLGSPTHDPHGDPIPDALGNMSKHDHPALESCEVGMPLTVARITDESPAFLKFIDHHGLNPGINVTINARDGVNLRLVLDTSAGEQNISCDDARKIHVSMR